eukprot:m.113404 g.113404  ORF g.113404 m.113404 type:complete len:65 (-) comp28267_c0_seq1:275-469(-)
MLVTRSKGIASDFDQFITSFTTFTFRQAHLISPTFNQFLIVYVCVSACVFSVRVYFGRRFFFIP